jgi:hypothetical protein
MPPWLYPTDPADPLAPYDMSPSWQLPRWDEYHPGSTEQNVFPLHYRAFLLVLDPLHTRAMRDTVSLARRLLECTQSSSPRSPILPFIVICQEVSDGTVDNTEPDTVSILYTHVQKLGQALWQSKTLDATSAEQVGYKLHLFQLAVILANVMYQCGLGDDSQTEAWIWEKQLFRRLGRRRGSIRIHRVSWR